MHGHVFRLDANTKVQSNNWMSRQKNIVGIKSIMTNNNIRFCTDVLEENFQLIKGGL